jgi:hypothetical protein
MLAVKPANAIAQAITSNSIWTEPEALAGATSAPGRSGSALFEAGAAFEFERASAIGFDFIGAAS